MKGGDDMKMNIHGGDTYSYNKGIIDFSANINPLGLPKKVGEEIVHSIKDCAAYPDIFCRDLTKAIAMQYDIEESKIVCGNGAAELIYKMALAFKPKKALVLAPTFAEYVLALKTVNCEIVYHYLDRKAFLLKTDILERIREVDMLFICNPNNPTGLLTEPSFMKEILAEAEKNKVLMVVDECFNHFLDEPKKNSMKGFIESSNYLIILNAFTKIYAMAGIRLGYGFVSNPKMKEDLFSAGPPWSVSIIAQRCGVVALQQELYLKESKKFIAEQRELLKIGLKQSGLTVFDSQANYIFLKSKDHELHSQLLKKNILIRDCSNYENLEKGYYRIAVRTEEENKYLLKQM